MFYDTFLSHDTSTKKTLMYPFTSALHSLLSMTVRKSLHSTLQHRISLWGYKELLDTEEVLNILPVEGQEELWHAHFCGQVEGTGEEVLAINCLNSNNGKKIKNGYWWQIFKNTFSFVLSVSMTNICFPSMKVQRHCGDIGGCYATKIRIARYEVIFLCHWTSMALSQELLPKWCGDASAL